MDVVNIGVVGIGNIGTAHAACIAGGQIDGLRLAAVCDVRRERLDYCREHFPEATVYRRWEEMLEDAGLDAVVVATPHRLHAAIAMAALERGLHTLVEKPADISVTRAAQLNAAAAGSGKVFAIMFNQRTDPVFRRAREIVRSGALGALKRTTWIVTNWYRTQGYYDSGSWRATWSGEGGGVLINQAPHNLDLWQWICGMPCTVTAFCDEGKYHRIQVEDDVTLFTRYANGATGTFIATTGEYPGTNRLEIAGDRGKIVLENGTLKWWRLPESERDFCFDPAAAPDSMAVEYTEYTPEDTGAGHAGILQNFANAILKGEALIAPGTDGLWELSLSNAAYLSQWRGNVPVTLPVDGEAFDRALAQRVAAAGTVAAGSEGDAGDRYLERWNVNW